MGSIFFEWCSCWTYVYGMSLNATTHLSVFDSNPPLWFEQRCKQTLGSGFKYLLFSSLFGEDFHRFWLSHIFRWVGKKTTNQNKYIDSAFLLGGAANRITLQQELEFAEFFGTKYRRTFPSPSAVSSAMQLGCVASLRLEVGCFRIRYRYVGIHDRDRWRGMFVDVFSKCFIFNMDLMQLGWFRSYVLRY